MAVFILPVSSVHDSGLLCTEAMDGEWTSMRSQCEVLKGVSFGSDGEYCAVPGTWTQLSSKQPGDTTWQNIG